MCEVHEPERAEQRGALNDREPKEPAIERHCWILRPQADRHLTKQCSSRLEDPGLLSALAPKHTDDTAFI
jgi:hypothetical protein